MRRKKAYVLSESDRRAVVDLLRRNDVSPPYEDDDSRETIWLRVKTGATIMPMSGPDGSLVPGEGIGVQWRQSQRINAGNNEPVLTKNDRDASGVITSEGQDYTSAPGDLEYKVYNYTPFELFECSWFCAQLSKRGQWVVNSPPLPLYFAKSDEVVPTNGVADAELGALDYDTISAGDNPVPSYFSGITRPVYNPGSAIEADTPFLVSQEPGGKFVCIPGGGEGPKRVRFKLTTAIQTDGTDTSGRAQAEVIDPLNSGLAIGDTLQVHDPRKEFCFSQVDSIGWATKGISSVSGSSDDRNDEWIIESCTQLVVRVKAVLGGCLTPWEGSTSGGSPGESSSGTDTSGSAVPEISDATSESYWPYVMWLDSEPGILENVTNPQKFVAADGAVWLERRELEADTQQPDGVTTPYTDSEPAYEWVIVAVEKPTANYARLQHAGNGIWTLSANGDGDYWDGHQPGCNEGATVPEYYDDVSEAWCAVPAGISGTGRLDKSTGEYVLVSTFSAYYGVGTKAAVIGKDMEDTEAGDLLTKDEEECGRLNYKLWQNAIVFGNPDTGSCKLDHLDPDPYVDLAPYTQAVVTGVTTDSNGDVALETKEIKSMCEPDNPSVLPLPYSSTDVVEDVYCDGDGVVNKTYKQIRYIGNDVSGSSNTVALECTNPSNYDWQYIFENYIYNEDWWTINYYDITYPEGCTPCPCECCKQTLLDESVVYQSGLTAQECADSVVSNPVSDSDVVAAECVDPSEGCEAPVGCCTLYDINDGELAQYPGVTDAECQALQQANPDANSAIWDNGADCLDVTGCCTGGAYDGQQVLEGVCTAGGGTWTPDPCSSSGCDGTVVSGFQIGGLGAGMCTAQFNQIGTATVSGGTATVNGTWTGTDAGGGMGGSPGPGGEAGIPGLVDQPGTLTVTTDGSNWAWTGSIWDGASVSGADTGTCGGAFSGSTDGSFGNGTMSAGYSTTCNDQWINGQWSFSAS